MRSFLLFVCVAACGSHNNPTGDDAMTGDGNDSSMIDGPTANVTPQLLTSFAGESGAAGTANCGRAGGMNCAYRDHADATIASNGTYIVEATGQSITVYDAASGNQLQQTSTAMFLAAAGGTAGGKINDPYIDYNEFAQRWIVSIPTTLQDLVIVSASSDPRGTWSGSALTQTNKGDVTIKLAHDRNGEYLGEYVFDGMGSLDPNTASFAWYCFAIPTTEIAFSGAFAPAHTNKHNCAYEARPVMDHDPAKATTAPFYYLGKTCAPGSCQNSTNFALGAIVHRGTWTGATITFDSVGSGGADQIVSTGYLYNTPIGGTQGTGPAVATTESHRVFAAEQRGTVIHGVISSGPCTSNCGAQGADTHDLIYYVAIDVASYPSLALADKAKLASPSLDVAYPGLVIDRNSNIGITSMCTSATQKLSSCAWAHGASDAPGAFAGPVVLVPGTQVYTCNAGTQVGTGTYANAVIDGADPTAIWMVEQDGQSATSCQWTTRITKLAIR